MMLRSFLLSGLLCGALCPSLRAQDMPQAIGPGSSIVAGAGVSVFSARYGDQSLAGPVFHVEVNPHWRLGFDGDVRLLRYHSDANLNESTYLGGPRATIMHWHRVEGYVKGLAGVGHITLPYGYATGSFFAYAVGGGIVWKLNDVVAVRAPDVEYQRWQKFPYGTLAPYGISTGLLISLTPVHRFPKH